MNINVFESAVDDKPLQVMDYKINFLSNSKTVKSATLNFSDNDFTFDTKKSRIKFTTGIKDEGTLNIYLSRLPSGKCMIHIFGKIKGYEVKFEKKLSKHSESAFDMLNERIFYILLKSRSMLLRYYLNGDHNSICAHLTTYLK